MKRIITFLILISMCIWHADLHAQAYVTLKADTNSVYVGAYEHPVNTLRAKYSDSGLAIIGTDNTVFTADRKYNTYINGATSQPFETFDSLKAWVRQYFFVDASAGTSGGGGDTATLTSVTTGTGNNLTPNVIQVSDASNLDLTLQSTVVYNYGASIDAGGVGITSGGNLRRLIEYSEDAGQTNLYNDLHTQSVALREQTGLNAGIVISGRTQGQDGINASDYATMSQLISLGETSTTAYRGDRGKTAYDHSQLTSGTNPHNTTFANIASLPTTIAGYGITNAIISGGQSNGVALSLGTNDNNIVNIRTNNATRFVFTQSGNFLSTGGITTNTATITPTHSLTVPSVGTGIAFYNTVDQTTNYERLSITKTANVFNINTDAGGTGTIRNISINGSIFNSSGITATRLNISALNTAPASATDTGTTGEIRITAGFIYVCIASNTWVRAALATW